MTYKTAFFLAAIFLFLFKHSSGQTDSISSKFDTLITKADSCLKIKQYEKARDYYKQAVAINPKDKYSMDQLSKIDAVLKVPETSQIIRRTKLIEKADSLFQKNNFDQAKKYYEESIKEYMQNDKDCYHAQKQIQIIIVLKEKEAGDKLKKQKLEQEKNKK